MRVALALDAHGGLSRHFGHSSRFIVYEFEHVGDLAVWGPTFETPFRFQTVEGFPLVESDAQGFGGRR